MSLVESLPGWWPQLPPALAYGIVHISSPTVVAQNGSELSYDVGCQRPHRVIRLPRLQPNLWPWWCVAFIPSVFPASCAKAATAARINMVGIEGGAYESQYATEWRRNVLVTQYVRRNKVGFQLQIRI